MSKVFIDEVNLDYFTTNVAIGENAGETFTFNAGAGNFAEGFWIHRLTFSADDQYIKGCGMVIEQKERRKQDCAWNGWAKGGNQE